MREAEIASKAVPSFKASFLHDQSREFARRLESDSQLREAFIGFLQEQEMSTAMTLDQVPSSPNGENLQRALGRKQTFRALVDYIKSTFGN